MLSVHVSLTTYRYMVMFMATETETNEVMYKTMIDNYMQTDGQADKHIHHQVSINPTKN